MNLRYAATRLLLIAVLSAGLDRGPVLARYNSADQERPIRLYATAGFGPIGAIKVNSLSGGVVAIDGRIAQGGELIWGGELIKVLADRTARVALDAIGEVTLARGAMVRIATGRASSDDAGYRVLVASLLQGSIDVKLNASAGAYVEAAASAFTASRGASFSVRVQEERAALSTNVGLVRVQDQAVPQDVNIRVVDELGRPVSSGSQLSVRARSTRQIQVQVTDRSDKPLPDLPVLFSLGNPCLGSLGLGALAGQTLMQKTDNRGIATVPLIAGAIRCASSIVAKVEGTNASVSIPTNIRNLSFWTVRNTTLFSAAAAGAGIGIGIAVTNSGGAQKITPVLPPTIRP